MSYEVTERRLDAKPVLSIRGRVPVEDIQSAIGEFLREVWRTIEAAGEHPAGPPFTRYHEIGEAEVLLEAGMPVPTALDGEGRVEAGELPGGEAISTDHYGPYEDLPSAGDALAAWAEEHGRRPAGPNWEVYRTDPGDEEDPADWHTEVFMPLEPG
jgi:effector-binding domain-containing protein